MAAIEQPMHTFAPEALAPGRTLLPLGPDAAVERPQPPAEEIPQAESDLPYRHSQIHELTLTAAGELDIPIAGGVSGGFTRRVVVSERVAYARLRAGDDTYHYGWAIRLAITVSERSSGMKLTLPFIAAASELGQVDAKWSLQVVGLSGPRVNAAILPPTKLNVETFLLAQQSVEKLIAAVQDKATRFIAQPIAIETSAARQERAYVQAALRTYALGSLERGWSLDRAVGELRTPSDAARVAIGDTYREFAGLESPDAVPPDDVRRRAAAIMAVTR